MKVSDEEFIRAWQSSSSVAEFCQKTQMKASSASVRSKLMRHHGVPLKQLGKKEWNKLIELAKELCPESNGAA